MAIEETALRDRVDHLQRTFVPPRELTGSLPRDVALTAAGRALQIAATVLFGIALTVGLLLSAEMKRQGADRQAFETRGTTATASVTRLWRNSNDDKQPQVAYRYEIDGREYQGQAKMRLGAWRQLREGSPLDIRYLPDDPTRSRLANVEPHSMPFWVPVTVGLAIATAPILLLVALNGQRRLLMEGRPAPALVTKLAKHHSSHGGSHRSIRYAFPLLSGSMATGRSDSHKGADVGSVICIVYDPDRPRRSRPYPFELVRPTKAAR